jgi:hypothetical protein
MGGGEILEKKDIVGVNTLKKDEKNEVFPYKPHR